MKSEPYYQAVGSLSKPIAALLMQVSEVIAGQVREIRLRAGKPICLVTANGQEVLSQDGNLRKTAKNAPIITQQMLEECLLAICEYSLHTYQQDIAQGFVTLKGGHRAGLAGSCVWENGKPVGMRDLSSICLRIAREKKSCADELQEALNRNDGGMLIAGAPGSGKTTLLRELARTLGDHFHSLTIVDERGEIASCTNGVPQLDTGLCSDVLSDYRKGTGIEMAVRTLAPEFVLCDELGGTEDIYALRQSVCRGVRLIATIHAENETALFHREGMRELLDTGAFSQLVFLQGNTEPGKIRQIVSLEKGWNE